MMLPGHQTIIMVSEHVHVCGKCKDCHQPSSCQRDERKHGRPAHPGPPEAAPQNE